LKAKHHTKWIIAAAMLGAIWLAWNVAYPSGTWRYKITVEVETPEGIKTGLAVREVTFQRMPHPLPHMKSASSRLKGEAVVVDLGKRGVLFALINGYKIGVDHAELLPFYIFSFPKNGPTSREGLGYYSNLKAGPKELEPQYYPVLVRFRDMNDPKTVESLLEMEKCPGHHGAGEPLCVQKDRFEEAFGEGVKVKAVTIEMTDEPITTGIVKWLHWLPNYYNVMLDGSRVHSIKSSHPLANSFSSGSFSVGILNRER